MDDEKHIIENFETILKESRKNKNLSLYRNKQISTKPTNRPQDVIKLVSSQMKAIQMADSINSDKVLQKHKKSNILAENMFATVDKVLHRNKAINKFETQGVSDTQLIDVVNVAEAFDVYRGITQDLDISITVSDLEKMNRLNENSKMSADVNAENDTCKTNRETKVNSKNVDSKIDNLTDNAAIEATFVGFTEDFIIDSGNAIVNEDGSTNKCVEIHEGFEELERDRCMSLSPILNTKEQLRITNEDRILKERDKERSVSPIFNVKNTKKSKSPLPLVYNLESFEKFEQIAIPLVEENDDLETAKHLINSQILDKELFLPSNTFKDIASKFEFPIKHVSDIATYCDMNEEKDIKKLECIDYSLRDVKQKTSSILEDEILFSSDEENYEYKEIQDLPFTCALETSFYAQSDILDKTMYVGFQTASNKTIQVCTESFNKAKSILKEIEPSGKKELTLTELVNICDSVSKHEKQFSSKRVISPVVFEEKDDSLEIQDLTISTLNKFREKMIREVNDENILSDVEVKTVHDSKPIEDNIRFNDNFKDMSMLDAMTCHTSDVGTDDALNSQDCKPISNIETTKTDVFEGFKTASKKIIKLSDAALATCQKVFHDIDLDEENDENNRNIKYIPDKNIEVNKAPEQHRDDENSNKKPNIIDNEDIQTDINDESILQEFENIEMSIGDDNIKKQDTPSMVGFKTASDKNIKISEKATEKAKHLFQDIDMDFHEDDNLKPYNMVNDTKNMASIPKNTVNIGFKTASNKNINITLQALAKSKTLFQDIELNDVDTEESNCKRHVLPNEKKKTITDSDKLTVENFNQPSTSAGVSTTNNKKITISYDALLKTNNVFKNITEPAHKKSIEKAEFNRFKTASNKQVKVLEESLLKRKQILSDMPDYNVNSNADSLRNDEHPVSNTMGFKTASNKAVQISAKAFERSRKIFQEEIAESNPTVPNFVGFQTANQKPVCISLEALEKSKKIFQDLDVIDHKLKSGSKMIIDKNDQILGQSLEKTKQIPSSLDCNYPNETNSNNVVISTGFKGFKTASKKDVKISKLALEKCKNIFQDINLSDDFCDSKTNSMDEVVGIDGGKKETMLGFKTASNKSVAVSSASLARSKRLFQDIDDNNGNTPQTNKNVASCDTNSKNDLTELNNIDSRRQIGDYTKYNSENINIANVSNFCGFKTTSNKHVRVSEQALAKTKQIFKDIDNPEAKENEANVVQDPIVDIFDNKSKRFKKSDDLKEIHVQESSKINQENIEDMINTQVLNNFENTLHTEDFHQEINTRNKRSGSPILSCPKAKRRRFETPYRTDQKVYKVDIQDPVIPKQTIFTENYKKNKLYRLKDLSINTFSVDKYIINCDFDNLLNFEFIDERNDLTVTQLKLDSLKEIFLASVNTKLVPKGWLDNHIRLILWKLISYEVKFNMRACTARNLLNQLKYRYDRELYNAERPALRKILEKDDVSTKTIVLCVVAVYDGGVKVDSVATTAYNIELLLTDGWYYVMACLDKMLMRLVREKKIYVGSKIVTNGAELLNCEQGVAPWEDTSSIRLKIFGNSTRRARWDARLGYHGNAAISTQLSNVKLDGGKVSKLRLNVTRVYPALYVEKFDDGSTVTRSERLEHLHQMKYEAERQALLEKLYEEVEKEFSDQDSQDSEGISYNNDRKTSLQSGSQIFDALKRGKDPGDLRNYLTSSQTKLLEDHTSKRREKLLEKVQVRLMEKIEKNGLKRGRNVVTVLKVRVAGVEERDTVVATKGILSIWKPNDALMDLIKEDTWIEVLNVVPTAVRYSEIQLSAGRQSVFIQSKYKESDAIKPYIISLKRICYPIKDLNTTMTTEYNEVDTAGIIFSIEPSTKEFDNKSQFQNVYLADKDCNIVCINFWGGLQKFGYQVLDTGQTVAGINLQKRAGNTRYVPQYRVTEFTYFTKTPKNRHTRGIIDDLNKISVLDRRRICEECVKKKNSFSIKANNENITPYRINNVDLARNRAFLNSVERITHSEFNLTGLDFESTFKQKDGDLSPKTLKRKKEVNNRINKLKMYGEPPPLTPIHIINKSMNAMGSYKSPLTSDSSSSVVRVKNILNISRNDDITPLTTSKCTLSEINRSASERNVFSSVQNKDSPVTSLNKTYVKSSVNPVKLNFDNNASDLADQFAEEFDASPPLSLD